MSNYAIISVGGKQYSVREGERLLVDRVKTDEGKTFHPDILFAGGDGKADLKPKIQVTAKVLGHVKGEKIRIGKYRRRTGYRRHTGYRSSLTQIEITAIGAKRSTAAKKPATAKKTASTTKKEES
jgi:large subunit ribosomal protein L21